MMLIDKWNPGEREGLSKLVPTLARNAYATRYRARRFAFSDEVTTSLAHLLRDFPNALLDNYQFALPPYPCTYMEFDLALFLRELGARVRGGMEAWQSDRRVAYIVDGAQVYVLAETVDGRDVGPGPVCYSMGDHSPIPGMMPIDVNRSDIRDERGERYDLALALLLGSTLSNDRASLNDQIAADMVYRFRPWLDLRLMRSINKTTFQKIMLDSVGDIRNMLALLLWLNQPSIAHYVAMPAGRAWVGNKKRAYAAHHIVQLKKNTTVRSLLRAFAPRRAPRRHEVESFWRNHQKTPGCMHDWPIWPDEHGHWHCRKCPQWRHRIKSHERGDAQIGYVTKEYKA